MPNPTRRSRWPSLPLPFLLACALAACGAPTRPEPAPPEVPEPPPPKVGLALGGGAAKGFAHIGVIKMLEANGIDVDVVAGTSAGSMVGAMYAAGMDAFQLQRAALALDEAEIRDVRLFSGGLVQGQALQDYVNRVVERPIQRLDRPFAAVATRLEDGKRTVFLRGDTGLAVRASSSVPGVFEPVAMGQWHYVDGGVVSPVPVDAARQLGADFVIAVDISTKASGTRPTHLLGIVNQSIAIMGQQLGAQELARADVVVRPDTGGIGPADFAQRDEAILLGEQAALAALPQIRRGLEQRQRERRQTAAAAAAERAPAPCPRPSRWSRWTGRAATCG